MKRICALLFCFVLAAGVALADDPKPADTPKTDVISPVKSSAANDVLIELSKSETADKAALDAKLQQARGGLDATTKSISDQIQTKAKSLDDQIKNDKKYKPLLKEIANLQKGLSEAQSKANQAYQAAVGPLSQKLQTETAQVDGLIKVVKKENGLPDNATFDVSTQKWTVPDKK